jgi:hypothetical protein
VQQIQYRLHMAVMGAQRLCRARKRKQRWLVWRARGYPSSSGTRRSQRQWWWAGPGVALRQTLTSQCRCRCRRPRRYHPGAHRMRGGEIIHPRTAVHGVAGARSRQRARATPTADRPGSGWGTRGDLARDVSRGGSFPQLAGVVIGGLGARHAARPRRCVLCQGCSKLWFPGFGRPTTPVGGR